jgi:nitroreductase
MDALEAITTRFSARAFLDTPVDKIILEKILHAAGRAPSGVNTQPWQVAVLTGQTKDKLGAEILKARDEDIPQHPDYNYYPTEWFDPYKTRRKDCGAALYGALNIEYGDKEKRLVQWNRNYTFFDAPVGLLFFIDGRLDKGSWMDCAMFIQSIMIAARHFGLHTCPQASLAEYPDIVRRVLNKPSDLKVICGMAMGYADESAPVNHYRTSRLEVDDFTQWFT